MTNSRGTYSAKFGDSLNNTKFNAFVTRKLSLNYKEEYDFCKANKIRVSAGGYITRQKRREPGAYDILACLDTYCQDTFEDFCAEYGYEDQPLTEHGNILRTYMAVKDQCKGLRRIFNESQLELLADIN